MFIRLNINGHLNQIFIDSSISHFVKVIDIPQENVIVDQKASIVAVESTSKHIVKAVKSRTWHEYIKYLWGRSRDFKEVKGNKILSEMGLRVPKLISRGYGIVPGVKSNILGFYVMENMNSSGFRTVYDEFRSGQLTQSDRLRIIGDIVSGMRAMQLHRILYTDFHMENVMVNDDGQLVWMDTGVTTYTRFQKRKFLKKNNQAIHRFIRYYSDNYFNQEEKEIISSLIL